MRGSRHSCRKDITPSTYSQLWENGARMFPGFLDILVDAAHTSQRGVCELHERKCA